MKKPLALLFLTVFLFTALFSGQTNAASQAAGNIPLGTSISFKSKQNDKYLCADSNYSSLNIVLANRTVAGPWEKFRASNAGNQTIGLYSLNNWQYLNCFSVGSIVMARGGRTIDANNEKWAIQRNDDGTVSLKNKQTNMWASIANEDDMLCANSNSAPSDDEKFYVEVTECPIGATVSFQSLNNDRYLFAELKAGDPPEICADGTKDSLAYNETKFVVEFVGGNSFIALKSLYNNQYLRVNDADNHPQNQYVVKTNGGTTVNDDRERFKWYENGDGTIAIRNVYTGDFLCADSNAWPNRPFPSIYANRTDVAGDWEKFYCILR